MDVTELKRPTRRIGRFYLHILASRPIERDPVVPRNNNAIDFAPGGQAMTSKTPSFVEVREVEKPALVSPPL